ncbi:hypothetical protein NIF40_07330 [[Clostridium] leptum]|nr:hypothetical protein [[Clostridium] leptum]
MKKAGLLDAIAERHHTHIFNLRLQPELKWATLGDLYHLENKEQYSLDEWEEAVSYLLGCQVRFENYEEIGKSLKPFSLKMR